MLPFSWGVNIHPYKYIVYIDYIIYHIFAVDGSEIQQTTY